MSAEVPTVAQVRQLTSSLEHVVPVESTDGNGHLNMAQYLSLHDQALWPYNARLGFDKTYRDVHRRGLFTLEQHLTYRAEVLAGDVIAVHCRLLSRTSKLVHGISFIVNESRGELSNVMEFVTAHVDLERRRVVEFSTDRADALDRELNEHRALGWEASISRRISVSGGTALR